MHKDKCMPKINEPRNPNLLWNVFLAASQALWLLTVQFIMLMLLLNPLCFVGIVTSDMKRTPTQPVSMCYWLTLGVCPSGMFPRCRISVCVKATVATVILIQLLYIPLTVFLYWNQVSTATVPTTTTTPKLRNEQTTAAMPTNETVERFLEEYEEYCRLELRPKLSNVRAWRLKVGRRVNESDPDLCPCIPDTLGKICVCWADI